MESLGSIYRLFHDCTVRLETPTDRGTGFFVAPGWILTCHHVVEETPYSEILVTWQGQNLTVLEQQSDAALDVARLRVDVQGAHPCVKLGEAGLPGNSLYSHGYPDAAEKRDGTPLTITLEGEADQGRQLMLQGENIRPGFSGSPVLNQRTLSVCGLIRRERQSVAVARPQILRALGGVAVPTSELIAWWPDLADLNAAFHQQDSRWSEAVALSMNQTVLDETVQVAPDQRVGDRQYRNVVTRQPEDCQSLNAEEPGSVHLVVAVFWQERSKQKLRVQPKLCYRQSETPEISNLPLVKDDPSVVLSQFPSFLTNLVNFTIQKIACLSADIASPWTLNIELFVPVDLLGLPLSTWCGQDGTVLQRRAVVIGCSDRFDAHNPESFDLQNQLEQGWKRFQSRVPDHHPGRLSNLAWLESDHAPTEHFASYSGFRCYGTWLKPGATSVRNWLKLVQSGIPLALWMCEGQMQRQAIATLFDRLIDCTRFEFLNRILRERDIQQQTCKDCVGVMYEDPNYLPDRPPTPEVQFFAWPS